MCLPLCGQTFLHPRLPASFQLHGTVTGALGRLCIFKTRGPWTSIGLYALLVKRAFLLLAFLTEVRRSRYWTFLRPRSVCALSVNSSAPMAWPGFGVCLREPVSIYCAPFYPLHHSILSGLLLRRSSLSPAFPVLPCCGSRSFALCFPHHPKGDLLRFVLCVPPLCITHGR